MAGIPGQKIRERIGISLVTPSCQPRGQYKTNKQQNRTKRERKERMEERKAEGKKGKKRKRRADLFILLKSSPLGISQLFVSLC